MQSDILLLYDVFENFKITCLNTHGLDSAYFYSWISALKMTKVELELLTGIDMLLICCQLKINKPVYLGFLIFNLSKTQMCKFSYD